MKFSTTVLPALAGVAHLTTAQDFVIPQTQRYVTQMLERFHRYIDYRGPLHGSALKPGQSPKIVKANVKEAASAKSCDFWMEDIKHHGIAAFNNFPNYTVFRNVKDFNAQGDGVTDDTEAINNAISSQDRSSPQSFSTSTNKGAVVYFPPGTYIISSSIISYYYTQFYGNPNCMPVIKATSNFAGQNNNATGMFDMDQYQPNGVLGWGATNVFYRQVRNFVFDMTEVASSATLTGIHWPASQATSLQNLVFKMSDAPGTLHQGVFMEQGSGGFLTDLYFFGGKYGMVNGNQQYTMRNLQFFNVQTALYNFWDWGWTYSGLKIHNASIGIDLSNGGPTAVANAGVIVMDSTIQDTPVGILTSHSGTTKPAASGSLVLENVQTSNVASIVKDIDGSVPVAGSTGSKTVAAYVQGHRYTPNGPKNLEGVTAPFPRPSSLLTGTNFYHRSKPQYASLSAANITTARSHGAKGDGVTDDTVALQKAINFAAATSKVLFVDAGTYKVTKTIQIPPKSKIVGESYSVIMSAGSFFRDASNPKPVVQVGKPNQTGRVEWSDMIVAGQGAQAGAKMIVWNLASSAKAPSGMWDVHVRIGGFAGSNLQQNNCPMTPTVKVTAANYKRACVGSYMLMHITPSASGLYMENNWLWTADHDLDSGPDNTRVALYSGRGFFCESKVGNIWMYGSGVEHNDLYQYQFVNTKNIFFSQIQSETPYYQPNPNATIPWKPNKALFDPTFPKRPYTTGTNGVNVPNAEAWGLRVIDSTILAYGVGLYSFFKNNSTSCSDQGNDSVCQSRIISLETTKSNPAPVYMYDVHTVGTRVVISTLDKNGKRTDVADWSDNQAGFSEEVILYRP